jgi:tyrosine-protein phosphatase YwqE
MGAFKNSAIQEVYEKITQPKSVEEVLLAFAAGKQIRYMDAVSLQLIDGVIYSLNNSDERNFESGIDINMISENLQFIKISEPLHVN